MKILGVLYVVFLVCVGSVRSQPAPVAFNGDTIMSQIPVLKWSQYAAPYHVLLSNTNDFTNLKFYAHINADSVKCDTILSQGWWYWKVSSDSVMFSVTDSFYVLPIYLINTNDSLFGTRRPTLGWHKYRDTVTSYRLQLFDTLPYSSPILDTIVYDTICKVSYVHSAKKIYWRISSSYDTDDFSLVDSFLVTSAPELIDIADTVYSLKPKIMWHRSMDTISSYQIIMDTTKNFSYNSFTVNVPGGWNDTTEAPSSNLISDKKYYYCVISDYIDSSEVDSVFVIDTMNVFYVSITATDTLGNGSKNNSFKYPHQAFPFITSYDTLKIAQGDYYVDSIAMLSYDVKHFTMLGGYSSDFSVRDVRLYKTRLLGNNAKFSYVGDKYLNINDSSVLDGIVFENFDTLVVIGMSYSSSGTISNCEFINSTKCFYVSDENNLNILNNVFAFCDTGIYLYAYTSSLHATIRNNTFFRNKIAVYDDGYDVRSENNIYVENNTAFLKTSYYFTKDTIAYDDFWGNDTLFARDSTKLLTIDSVSTKDSNVVVIKSYTLDPMFTDTTLVSADFTLKDGSPCIDSGNPISDYSQEPYPNGTRVNLGAYGNTPYASVSGKLLDVGMITVSPSDTVAENTDVTMSINVKDGTTPYSYKWFRNSISIDTTPILTLSSVAKTASGDYNVVVTNPHGSDTSVNIIHFFVCDTTPPPLVTGVTLTPVNCSTAVLSWDSVTAPDADSIGIVYGEGALSTPVTVAMINDKFPCSNSIRTDTLRGFAPSGVVASAYVFVKDSSGNWSHFDKSSLTSVMLPDGIAPENNISVTVGSVGDTVMKINIFVSKNVVDEQYFLMSINTDSLGLSNADTFVYRDTLLKHAISTNVKYFIFWAPVDSSGNIGEVKYTPFSIDNLPPIITIKDTLTAIEDVAWSVSDFVYDPNSDSISVEILEGPSGIIISNGTLSWIPANGDVGGSKLVLVASDGKGGKDTSESVIIVLNSNDAPVIVSVNSPDTVWEDSSFYTSVLCYDVDKNFGDSLYISVVPEYFTFVSATDVNDTMWSAKLIGHYPLKQVGLQDVTITLHDDSGASAQKSVKQYVVDVNEPPTLSIADKKLVYSAVKYKFSASDDFDTSFVYKIILRDSLSTVDSISTTTGIFEYYPLTDGHYSVECYVSDKQGLSVSKSDTFSVTNISVHTWDKSDKWNMISLPIMNFPAEKFKAAGSILHWDESGESNGLYKYYVRTDAISYVKGGLSYWIKSDRQTVSISLPKDSIVKTPVKIALNKSEFGWNQIASPYMFPVVLSNDKLTLWEWNSSTNDFEESDSVMYPYKGYWVLTDATDTVTLTPKPVYSSFKRRRLDRNIVFENNSNWSVRVELTTNVNSDRDNIIGVMKNISRQSLRNRPEPPRINSGASLFFINSKISKDGRFASDIRTSMDGSVNIYTIGVSACSDNVKELNVRIKGSEKCECLYFFVRYGKNISKYSVENGIELTPSDEEQYITLFASSNKELLSTLPINFSVKNPYPNPFMGACRISYILPYRWGKTGLLNSNPYVVKINIYDVRGRIVRSLKYRQEQPGHYIATWDGKTNGGRYVASGNYIVKITAGEYVGTKKIIMLR